MRPLDKGVRPTDSDNDPVVVTHYDSWRAHLINRIGYYCVYCNTPLSHSLQVEHVIPKNPPPGYTPGDMLAWENMLLACGPCNNAKGNNPIDFADYYFPEENNTFLAFKIIEHPTDVDAAVVDHANHLADHQIDRAVNTIELLGVVGNQQCRVFGNQECR